MQARRISNLGAVLSVFGAAMLAPIIAARADGFYQGKTLEIIVSTGAGADSYNTLSRLVSRHIAPSAGQPGGRRAQYAGGRRHPRSQ
jgi:hypothetical protein